MQELKLITVAMPSNGKPGTANFQGGIVAQFWEADMADFTAKLDPGTTAMAEIEHRRTPKKKFPGQFFENDILKAWGEPVAAAQKSKAGRTMSPEDRRSVALQTAWTGACELYAGTGDFDGAIKAAKGFASWHDAALSGDWQPKKPAEANAA